MRRTLVIDARSEKFHLHYATLLLGQKKIEEAFSAVERSLALNANNHDSINLTGRVAFERDELEESLAYYKQALALKPDLADAYNNMGNVLKELGRLEEAQNAYLEALRLDPGIIGVYRRSESAIGSRGEYQMGLKF